jgi:Cys-tRNA(Pro)/Cys-tRNA(Cys) deacylase
MTIIEPGLRRVIEHAEQAGVTAEVVECGSYLRLEEAASHLGIDLADVVKTMVLRLSDSAFVIVLVPGDQVLSWSKVRRALGVNRVSIATAAVAVSVTGYPKTGISPLGHAPQIAVLADERLVGRRIALRAGTPHHSIIVDADKLVEGLNATQTDLCESKV